MNWEFAITGCITLVVGIFGSTGIWTYLAAKREKKSEVYKKIDEIESYIKKYTDANKKSVMGLMYINIVKTCEYWIERGWVEDSDLRDLEHYLYDPYIDNGGNGTAERLFKEASALPHKPPKTES